MILEMAGRATQIFIALAGAYLVVLWFALIVWTFRDIEMRSRNVFTQIFATLMTVLFFVPGTLVYLLLRPKTTLDEAFQRSLEEEYLLQDLEELPHCPTCHRFVEDDYVLCPHCHTTLREPCGQCERLVELRWPVCPYCGTVHGDAERDLEKVEAPATRWTASTVRRRRGAESVARPHALPEQAPIRPEERVAATLAPAPDDTASFAHALSNGVRSIVRPIDRLLGRGDDHPGEPAYTQADQFASARGAAPGTAPNGDGSSPVTVATPVPVRNRFGVGDAGETTNGFGDDAAPEETSGGYNADYASPANGNGSTWTSRQPR